MQSAAAHRLFAVAAGARYCRMILVAPTDFKGTIPARAAAQAMARGARAVSSSVVELPLSDGGPGLISALEASVGRVEALAVSGPLGAAVQARLLWRNGTAVIESADACGLHLVTAEKRDPWHSTTRGVGELIAHAAHEAASIVVGLGGSATVDGGIGMAAALGWRFIDAEGREVPPYASELTRVEGFQRPAGTLPKEVYALADVHTPLSGPQGAARVFGPQKGVPRKEIAALDQALEHWGRVLERELHCAVRELPGAGAAGGLGAGLRAFLGARILPGSEWLLAEVGFDALLARAELLITGEGSFDSQSLLGKVTGVIIERAAARGVPVLLIAGRVQGRLPAHVHAARSENRRLSEADLERSARVESGRLLQV